jgi:hypothetical protein
VKQEVAPDADLSVTPESLPLTFDKVYDHLSDISGRRLHAPLLVEPGDQRLVRLRFEIPLVDSIARHIFRGKRSVATEVFCKRFESGTPALFNGNQRFLGEFLDPELNVQIAQSTDSVKQPLHLCYADVVQPGDEFP